jgi:hypothetical protein
MAEEKVEENGSSSSVRKDRTTTDVENKIAAVRQAIEDRLKDRFHGLPKSLAAFEKWRGEGHKEPLSRVPVQTLNTRKDLKVEVRKVIEERKNAPLEKPVENHPRIKELEIYIQGLASKNHEQELEIERLKADLLLREDKPKKFEQNRKKAGPKVKNNREER